jgi:hypothetical protein
MRHEFITIPHRWNVPSWSVNTLGPWKWRSWHQARSDNNVFPVLKGHFGGYKFTSDDKAKRAVIWWLQLHDTHFHKQGIKKLVFIYNRCIILGRDMVNSKGQSQNCKCVVFIRSRNKKFKYETHKLVSELTLPEYSSRVGHLSSSEMLLHSHQTTHCHILEHTKLISSRSWTFSCFVMGLPYTS